MNTGLKTACRGAALAALGVIAAYAGPAAAQDEDAYPCNVEVVIHSSYGGGTDTTARMMMIRTRRELKADMAVVAHRGGSGAKAQN